MRPILARFLGLLLTLTALAGIIISIFGIIRLWQTETEWKAQAQDVLTLLDTTLQTTSDGLQTASTALEQADSALTSLADATQTASNSLDDTLPLIDTLSEITTRDLPQAISRSQQAIQSAQVSARIIDSTLSTLASIPLIGLRGYDTSRPLSGALAELSRSLDPISASLLTIEPSLTQSKTSLAAISADADEIHADLMEIRGSLQQAKNVITEYARTVTALHDRVKTARTELPAALDRIAWFVSMLLTWLGFTQIGLLLQGLQLLGVNLLATAPKETTTD